MRYSPLFAASLLAASLVPDASAQLLHRYSFNVSGTTVADRVETADGQIIGGASMTGTGELNLDGINDYVEFPAGILGDQSTATFEAWYRWDDTTQANWARIMDFGSSTGGSGQSGTGLTYVVLTPQGNLGSQPLGIIKDNQNPNSTRAPGVSTTVVGALVHIALAIDSTAGTMSLYYNGALEGTVSINDDLASVDDENNWLGRAQFSNNPYFFGAISEFRIYGDALSDAEVLASFTVGPDAGSIGVNYCTPGVANSTGVPATMSAIGSPIASANNLTLGASDLPRFSFSFFITSMVQGNVSQPNGSQGTLCLSGAIGRYVGPGQIQQAGNDGLIALPLDLTQIPQPLGFVSASAGQTWNFQAWYRDTAGGVATSNFTDGLSVLFF